MHVGGHLFERAICGGKTIISAVGGKIPPQFSPFSAAARKEEDTAAEMQVGMGNSTRVLVTNQLHVLKSCDRVVILEGGRIVEQVSQL